MSTTSTSRVLPASSQELLEHVTELRIGKAVISKNIHTDQKWNVRYSSGVPYDPKTYRCEEEHDTMFEAVESINLPPNPAKRKVL